MNLTKRLSLTHGFIALLAVIVTLGVMIGGARIFFLNEIHDAENKQLDSFVLSAREAYFAHEDVEVLNFIKMTAKDEMVAFTAFVSDRGQRLILPPAFEGMDLSEGERTLSDGRKISVTAESVAVNGQKVGLVAIGYDSLKIEKRIQTQVQHWVELGAAAGLSALIVALFVSVFVAGHLARPLKRIREGTEEVRLGKLDKLVDVNRSDEIGDLARAFNTMVVQLKELDEMKRDFVAGVTHDFGTPLHAIKNAVEFLQDQKPGPLTAKQAEYLMMVSNSTIQLTTFINNLLTTASIEAAKAEPYFELFDARALAKEVVDLYQPLAEKKGIELKLECDTPTLSLVSDVTMMRQILTNMISNAMKYTVKGGAVVKLEEAGDIFILTVSDTGIGIDSKNYDVIFDKFFRIRQPKNFSVQQGAGLGLAIVKGLVEVLGGSIAVDSKLGEGTAFTVRFPRRNLAANDLKES
jgi:signal transduction histidine kinase